MRKHIAILLLALLLLCAPAWAKLPVTYWTEDAQDNSFEYSLDGAGNATLESWYGSWYGTEQLILPEALDGHPLTGIGQNALSNEWESFYDTVTIPHSITHITGNPFLSEAEVIIPPDHPVFEIRQGALFDKTNGTLIRCLFNPERTEYTVPQGTVHIGDDAFNPAKDSLESVILPEGVLSLGDGAFATCHQLQTINLPVSLTELGSNPFLGCENLTLDIAPDHPTLKLIDGVLFDTEAKRLIAYPCNAPGAEYAVPAGTRVIGTEAFRGAGSLRRVHLPEGVETIGTRAFYECNALTNVILPHTLAHIGAEAFGVCRSLTQITIPGSVTSILDGAFDFCSSLESVTFEEGVTKIGNDMFFACHDLQMLSIPQSVTTIGNHAFSLCEKLEMQTIPDSISYIGDGAFAGCEKLTHLAIPANVTGLGANPFPDCLNLTLAPDHPTLELVDGVLFDKLNKTLIAYPMNAPATEYTVPPDTKIIGTGAFTDCQFLERIILPEGVLAIRSGAFCDNDALKTVTVPFSVIYIAEDVFWTEHLDTKLIVPPYSYALRRAIENEFNYSIQ